MKRFLILSRAPFLTAIITPLVFGTALAYKYTGHVNWIIFLVTLVGLSAAHAGANLLNDYFDYKLGADLDNPNRNQFSGGSPHIVEGIEKSGTFLGFSIASLIIAGICGGYLAFAVEGSALPVIILAVAGLGIGLFYTAPPLKLAYRGLGELSILFAFGPLPVLGVWYVQTGILSWTPFIASIPISLLITNIIFINEFPDYTSDRIAGKKNLVVRLGLAASRYLYYLMAVIAFLLIAFFSENNLFGIWGMIGLAGIPFAFSACRILHNRFQNPAELLPAQGLTIITHLLTGVLLSVGLALGA